MSQTILLLHREEQDLEQSEIRALKERYGFNIEFVHIDPRNAQEHLDLCKQWNPVAVILPPFEPMYTKAVRAGIEHTALVHGKDELALRRVEPGEYRTFPFVAYFPVELAYFNNPHRG